MEILLFRFDALVPVFTPAPPLYMRFLTWPGLLVSAGALLLAGAVFAAGGLGLILFLAERRRGIQD